MPAPASPIATPLARDPSTKNARPTRACNACNNAANNAHQAHDPARNAATKSAAPLTLLVSGYNPKLPSAVATNAAVAGLNSVINSVETKAPRASAPDGA